MKKHLIWFLLVAAAFGQTTPNIHLNIPAIGSSGWGPLINNNFNKLDSILSGGTTIPGISMNSLILNGGAAITGQSGTGNLCLQVGCLMTSPDIGVATGTSLALGGGTPITTTNHTGIGSLVLQTAPTFLGTTSVSSSTGNGVLQVLSTNGGHTSTLKIVAVTSNANNGEVQFQIGDNSPFGWRFCTTGVPSACPLKIDGGAPDQFADFGGITSGRLTLTSVGNGGLNEHANNGANDSSVGIIAVTSNGNNGEMQLQVNNATPFGWRFAATNSGTTPVTFSGLAPTGSLVVNADGSVQSTASRTGTASNTDEAGQCTLGTNCAPARTFSLTYASAPICICSDVTAANACRVNATTTILTLTGTGADVLNYRCIGRN